MTDQPAPEGMGTPMADMPSSEPEPLAPLVAAAAAPPPMPAAAPMMAAAPPPAVAWQAPPAMTPTKGGRTALAAAGGIILLVLGVLGLLVGVLFFAGTAFVNQLTDQLGTVPGLPQGTDLKSALASAIVVIGGIVVAYSLMYIFAGIGVLRSKGWGRVLGILVGILSGLFWLAALGGGGSGDPSGGVPVMVLLGLHVYLFVVLIFFWRSKARA